MNGDIKLATLSDTDDTDVTGSELVTNGTFATDTTGWTGFVSTLSVVSNALRITLTGNNGWAEQSITTVVGETYTISFDLNAKSTTNFWVDVGTTSNADSGRISREVITTTGSKAVTFKATSTTTYVFLRPNGGSGSTADVDNVSVRLAEEDRSVNGNGLQVFGTVTKNPVATGADLVAYSFSGDNTRLEQPYNSDLDFGTGDFSYIWWMNGGAVSSYEGLFTRGSGKIEMIYTSSEQLSVRVGSSNQMISSALPTGVWNHCVVVRVSGVVYTYINGKLDNSSGTNGTQTVNTTEPLTVGNRESELTREFSGSLALLRASATVPSPEQIAKIYNDEKHLFQEGAQATLYGSSDAVTALAHDDATNLLHVGTSAGRSDFQGLRRVSNTTNAVGAAISASNGMIVEE
jgi:hypothetical protein